MMDEDSPKFTKLELTVRDGGNDLNIGHQQKETIPMDWKNSTKEDYDGNDTSTL